MTYREYGFFLVGALAGTWSFYIAIVYFLEREK